MNLEKLFSRLPDRLYDNFGALFAQSVQAHAELPALLMKLGGSDEYTTWTYAAFAAEVRKAARFLASRGLKSGDSFAVMSENRSEWMAAWFAATIQGIVAVPIDSAYEEEGIRTVLAAARCKGFAGSARFAQKALAARAAAPAGFFVLDFDLASDSGGFLSWRAALDGAPELELPPVSAVPSDAPATIIFTSGTTGVAKGIVLSHRALIANVNAARMALLISERDRFIAMLPLHHTYALTCTFLAPFEAGGRIVFTEKLIPTVILKHIRDSGVSILIGVPLVFDKFAAGIRSELRKLPGLARSVIGSLIGLSGSAARLGLPVGRVLLGFLRKKAGLGSIRLAVAGGGPLMEDTADFFEALGMNLVQGYGMSENGPLIAVNLPEYHDNHSVGVAVKFTEVRIADPGTDGIGEIQVRSPSLMTGYLDNPEATREAFTEDGWLRTGDLGRIDKRGFIFITGRSKNLIVTEGGKNVYPEEIEQKFAGQPFVLEVLVVGRKAHSGAAGDEIVAVLVPNRDAIEAAHPGRSADAPFVHGLMRDEVARVNRQLAQYMKISDLVVRADEFEKTSSRKIRRFLYQKQYGVAGPGAGT